ncbi:hypothetical protein TSTA_028890 [Talaromyces stipitatus ATCC 10500]|uniref:Uncharacterized protein n=1 Tax=Talaromyces stipitatus (strain ATCC 10500 / CBS 375.48 / QM 6759 / NRRL 1006) TaxID=441959 RepID=B8M7Q4_TALSN|nr:uncharacterized protein TSTA_028890 [Talaromyces stipitatus ATCC 10500]EED19607.1 hypothetical protein TSTA_028890 [Talaromyces stipitatus ATCC 10500]
MLSSNGTMGRIPCYLPDILGVQPNVNTKCVGFAVTKADHLCGQQASDLSGRAQASRLLNEGTHLLQAGEENIDDLLRKLAPLLLCNRHHQKDAPRLVGEWSVKVAQFNRRRFALLRPSPSPNETEDTQDYRDLRLVHTPNRASHSEEAPQTPVEETDDIEWSDRIRSTRGTSAPPRFAPPEQLSTSTDTIATTAPAMGQRGSHTPLVVSVSVGSPTSTGHAIENISALSSALTGSLDDNHYVRARVDIYPQIASEGRSRMRQSHYVTVGFPSQVQNTESTTLTYQSRTQSFSWEGTESQPLNNRASRNTTAESTHQHRSRGATSASTSQELARRPTSSRSEVTRKRVEGDCHICFLPLQDEGSDDEDEEAKLERQQSEKDDEYDSEHDGESSEEDEELAYYDEYVTKLHMFKCKK